jgi:ABC-type Mn2+/Zn2+ transport system ATPase subunit
VPGPEGGKPFVLRVEDVAVGHGDRAVVAGVSLALGRGDVLGIVGPNGSGKTTFVRTVLGLLPPVGGRIEREAGFRAGYVPQKDTIDPVFPFTASDVVRMAARSGSFLPFTAGAERSLLVAQALERVGLAGEAETPYRDLSGGQRQRVLLARALAARPTVLVLDEPSSGMDLAAETALLDLLRRLRREESLTVLLVSHTLALVANEATQVLLFHGGRHREGPVEEVLTGPALTALYGIPVRVAVAEGRRVVLGMPAAPA